MSKTNPIVEMPEPIEVPVTKKFSIPKAVAMTLTVSLIALSLLHTASAMFGDKVLESLERTYTGAIINYKKQVAITAEAEEQLKNLADTACDAYGALKNYKNFKKLPLKNDGNPCVEFRAPQEVGYVPPVVPGAEGQIEPDPAFR